MTDGRFRDFWSAVFTEHLRPTGFCSSALSGREYRCSRWSLEWDLAGILEWRARATAVFSGFCTIWVSLFVFFPFSSTLSPSCSPFFTFPRNTTGSTFHTVVRSGSTGVPWAKGRTEPGATRCPPSYTTDDVDIGQKKRVPTLPRRWLCRVTRLTCGYGSPRRYGSSRGPGAGETFSDIRASRVSPPTNQPTKHKQSSNVM